MFKQCSKSKSALKLSALVALLLLNLHVRGFGAGTASAASAVTPELAQKLSKAHFEFTLDLYRELARASPPPRPPPKHAAPGEAKEEAEEEVGNLLCSPFSLYSTLSMLFLGTSSSSDSSRQLRAALHFNSVSYVDAHTAFGQVSRSFAEDRYYSRSVRSANAVFAAAGTPLSPHYARALAQFYRSRVEELEYTEGNTAEGVVNEWVEDLTDGAVNRMLDHSPPVDSELLLVNALSMSTEWLLPFDPKDTFDKGLFFLPGEKRLEIPMMSGRFDLPLGHNSDLEVRVLEIPFAQRRVSLFVFLPDDPALGALARLEGQLTSKNVKKLLSTLEDQTVTVRLPRFRVSGEAAVEEALKGGLGVTDLFDRSRADLRLMTDKEGIVLSSVAHRSVLEVSEGGGDTARREEGSSAKSSSSSSILGEQYFEVDHPFLFMVWDYYSGMVLLMGRVVHPEVIAGETEEIHN